MSCDEGQKIGDVLYPNLELGDDVFVDLPDYDARKCCRARDGFYVIDAFKVYI